MSIRTPIRNLALNDIEENIPKPMLVRQDSFRIPINMEVWGAGETPLETPLGTPFGMCMSDDINTPISYIEYLYMRNIEIKCNRASPHKNLMEH